ncbi:hypothetical protein DFH08DRAFT_714601 [Mycena albidolilacea]|uniref:Transposase n=1 Tax=Mycena albidolilacea TaxID=1033008 RepID=A0AAD6ZDZ3_9AGAR|nr:hypothetical protein DFH08DRAFT_714601 [Mycena albidolilacea]
MPFRYIHPQQKTLLPTIKRTLPNNNDIATITDMNPRTVRRTLKNYYDYGDVVPPRMGQVGRRIALNGLDMCYLEGLIERRPDSTASELRLGLCEGMQIDFVESTITRALHNRGYSFKKVCTFSAHIL